MLFTHVTYTGVVSALLLLKYAIAVSFPAPTGPYQTTLTTTQLTDASRIDPFSPKNATRTLMLSIFQPISPSKCTSTLVAYMDNTTATYEDAKFAAYGIPPNTFGTLELAVCKPSVNRRTQEKKNFPVVLFSPGLGTSRLFYSVMAQEVASAGYNVITIDHPYDVDIVTFPDGSVIEGIDIESDEQVLLAVETRVKDMSFILDQLSSRHISRSCIPGLSKTFDFSRVGVFGHSLGGAAAVEALLSDSRIVRALNMDGSMFGKVVTKGTKKPVMLFSHEGKDLSADPTWKAAWKRLSGWKRGVSLAGSAHYTFSDLPNVVKVLGLSKDLPAEAAQLLGSIDGARAHQAITTYVKTFLRFVLDGKKSELLNRLGFEYPEISFFS